MPSLSDIIDCTIVLTLQSRMHHDNDRLSQHLKKELGTDERTLFFYVIPDTGQKTCNDGGGGSSSAISLMNIIMHNAVDETSSDICKNHMTMIRWAYDQNYRRVLFLEDDALFETLDPVMIERVGAWMDSHDWDIFYMGYCPWPIVATMPVAVNIVRIVSPYTSHAYILNRSGMEKILANPPQEQIHIDKHLATMPNLIKMGIYPSVCFQSNNPALYNEAARKLWLPQSFRILSQTLEMIAVMWPICLMIGIGIWVLVRFRRGSQSSISPRPNG